ncbi:MAG: protein kinase [Polyangiaceae bacterium]
MLDSVAIGTVLLGKYRVDGVIGEGGMGIVFLAFHLQLRERVALKFPKRETLRWPGASARFLSEARAAIRIKSEHVARVVDVGTIEDGTPFIVMEYLNGETLCQYATKHGPLPVENIVEFVTQISEAIAEAHALGIVHRDLKPANIFLTRRADGILSAKVLDFGISQVTGAAWDDIASKEDLESMLGSPAYASPEQLQSPNHVDARSDIWSLGVIMYELATGRRPFDAKTTVALCGQVMFDPFVPLRMVRSDLPMELCAAIDRCLDKDPARRHASVGHLAMELLPFAPARARASIERIVRTVEMGNDLSTVLVPVTRRNDSVLARGAKVITGILPSSRLVFVSWVALGIAIGVLVFRSSGARVGESTAGQGATTKPLDGPRRSAMDSAERARMPDQEPGRLRAEVSSTPSATGVRGGESPTGRMPETAPNTEPPRDTKASGSPSRRSKGAAASPAGPGSAASRRLPASASELSPSSLDQDLDDPAYSNRK